MFILNGKTLALDVPFEVDGVSYPANWLRLTSLEEKQALGITEVPDQPRPDDRYYWVTDNGDGTFTTTPKDLTSIKSMRVSEVKTTAGSLLAPSDWKVIRAVETDVPLPDDLKASRAAIRSKSNDFEAAINACTSVEQIASLTFDWE